ncbi:MAG: class I SAM-dependent methyltransferase [Polyangiaceae bacterium]
MSEVLNEIGLTDAVLATAKKNVTQADEQVAKTFGFKWAKRDTYDEAPALLTEITRWLTERYCAGDLKNLDALLEGGSKIILDAGCGSGLSASMLFGDRLKNHRYVGIDISTSVEVARARFKERGLPGDFVQWSLTDVPVKDESVDMVFSEGVLTFTESTGDSIRYLAKKLKKGGKFLFYVYAKKGPIREFADDHIRHAIAPLNDKDAWEALMPLTKLGIALGELNQKINVPEDIPYLGIKKGEYDVQRFFYWFVAKAFYKKEYDAESMNLINFDWYRPITCHRHTVEEVKEYCASARIEINHLDVQEAGITVVGTKF